VKSQRAMLERLGRKGARLHDAGLIRTYTFQLVRVQTWLQVARNVRTISIDYVDDLAVPGKVASRLAGLLGEPSK